MKNVAIIFGSTMGNTERVAEIIKDTMTNCKVSITDVGNAEDETVKSADLVLLGSSTWGYGDIQDDFLKYYESMSSNLFSGKDVAVFGCGNSEDYPDVYCEAVNLIKEKASQCGANVIGEGLKVDGDVEDNTSEIEAFAKSFC